MFHSRSLNNKINNLHEHSLHIVYKDNYSSYVDLLAKDKSFNIHQRNTQSLAIELFKVKRNLSNMIMCNILKREHWLTISDHRNCGNTRRYRLNSLSYFAPKVWDMIPLEIKNINSLRKFKKGLENLFIYLFSII